MAKLYVLVSRITAVMRRWSNIYYAVEVLVTKTFPLSFLIVSGLGMVAAVTLILMGLMTPASTAQPIVPTLTFHLISFGEAGGVLGGTLEGPEDSLAESVEMVVEFYKAGQVMKTETFNIDGLRWPHAHFQFPVPSGVECYDIITLRAFDREGQALPSTDETAKRLKPGRCRS